jgi:hypothetical protein
MQACGWEANSSRSPATWFLGVWLTNILVTAMVAKSEFRRWALELNVVQKIIDYLEA